MVVSICDSDELKDLKSIKSISPSLFLDLFLPSFKSGTSYLNSAR